MKIIAILSSSIMLFSITAFTQVKQGKMSYDVYFSSDDPAASGFAERMEGSVLEITFMDGKIRSDLFAGQMMTNTVVMNKKSDTALVLLDGMMGRIAMKNAEADMDEERRLAYENRSVELTNETKEVMGYMCKKAIITAGDSNEIIVWYTEEIVPTYRKGDYLYEEIPGLPIEIYGNWWNLDMKAVAFEFKEKLKKTDEIFITKVPEGFTLRTADEMNKMGQ